MGNLSLQGDGEEYPDCGKATNQDANRSMATTDTRPPTGMESSTTVDVCNSAITNGNECQDVALLVAPR